MSISLARGLTASAFVEYLQETLKCVVEACHHEAPLPSSPCLVLIDSTQCSLAQMMRWSHIDKIAAFNVEHEDDAISPPYSRVP